MPSPSKKPIDAEFRATVQAALVSLSDKAKSIGEDAASLSKAVAANREEQIRFSERVTRNEKDVGILLVSIEAIRLQQSAAEKARNDWENKHSETMIKSRLINGAIQIVVCALMSAVFLAIGSGFVKTNIPNHVSQQSGVR